MSRRRKNILQLYLSDEEYKALLEYSELVGIKKRTDAVRALITARPTDYVKPEPSAPKPKAEREARPAKDSLRGNGKHRMIIDLNDAYYQELLKLEGKTTACPGDHNLFLRYLIGMKSNITERKEGLPEYLRSLGVALEGMLRFES